jgi:hypothetical protein
MPPQMSGGAVKGKNKSNDKKPVKKQDKKKVPKKK